MKNASFFELKGKTLTDIKGLEEGSEYQTFITDTEKYVLEHQEDCCESVILTKIIGDVNSILNSEIVLAEDDIGANEPEWAKDRSYYDSYTWSKYVIETKNGGRLEFWYLGESNGYYCEAAIFYKFE